MRGTQFLGLAVFAIGCSGGDFEIAPTSDAADAELTDSSVTPDGGEPADSSSTDSPIEDSATHDSAVVDSGTVKDTGIGAVDTGALDTGAPDSTMTCPMPPTTATFDASGYSCAAITAKYGSVIGAAKACTCDADCSKIVGRDFCGCTTAVNPGTEAYAAIGPLRDRYEKLKCMTACSDAFCMPVVSAKCVPEGSAGTMICKDVGAVTP